MLVNLLDKEGHISVTGCGFQMCFFLGLCGTYYILLTLMGYDCFLGICNPLRYA
ncbi:rCG20496, partial [Rattus norvegicus]